MSNKHVSHKHGGKANPRMRPKSTQGKRRNKANARVIKAKVLENVKQKKIAALADIE